MHLRGWRIPEKGFSGPFGIQYGLCRLPDAPGVDPSLCYHSAIWATSSKVLYEFATGISGVAAATRSQFLNLILTNGEGSCKGPRKRLLTECENWKAARKINANSVCFLTDFLFCVV